MIMTDQKKLDRWAEKLLDTGKRNNLINYHDSKASSAEIVVPDCKTLFSKCSVGHSFEIYDPKIIDDTDVYEDIEDNALRNSNKSLTREEYIRKYSKHIKNDLLLVYALTPNPLKAVKNIAKKAKEMLDETGNNVAYLAFGFLKWNEREDSQIYFRAPLLLVHVNLITGSVIEPIKIEISDDDVIVNPTFNYLLQAEYGITLPEYTDNDNLYTYYSKVSLLVRGMNWEILDECKLGIFPFLKINMYEDLKKNADKILNNGNIKALLGDTTQIQIGNLNEEYVVKNPLIDLHTVVEADSSQIEAIEMAKSGRSFVLQGPPGTGKSQTITNIIAECLYDGKKVLFVSEKQAALNVVYDKLTKAGLSDFCLELHSHKANKKAIIEELNRTLEMPKKTVSSRVNEEIRIKKEAQTKLDTYAVELHKKHYPIDKSLYQLFELYSSERNSPDINVPIKEINQKGQDYLLSAVKLLEQYVEYIPSIGSDYRKNVWYGFNNTQMTFDEMNQFKEDLELALGMYQQLDKESNLLSDKYGIEEMNYSDSVWWKSVLDLLSKSDVFTPLLLSVPGYNNSLSFLQQLADLSNTALSLKNKIAELYDVSIIESIDGRESHGKLTSEYSSWFTRLFNGSYKELIRRIKSFSNNNTTKYPDALEISEQLMIYQETEEKFKECEEKAGNIWGPAYNGLETDWDHFFRDMGALKSLFTDGRESLGRLSEISSEEYEIRKAEMQSDGETIGSVIGTGCESKKRISELFSEEQLDLDHCDYDSCIKKLYAYYSNLGTIGNWMGFLNLMKEIDDLKLTEYIDEIIKQQIAPEDIVGAYKKRFYQLWIEYDIYSIPGMATLTRIQHDQAVRNFSSKDEVQYELSKYKIQEALSQQRPDLNLVSGGSAVSILRREGAKKRKQMPIRKLLSETGSLVQIIKPCFLMSPLSVSTFLDPEKISFDTIIFDEASQIFPQDAIGAIYRGKQLIVVGDSKQMPPSNFFNSTLEVDDEDEEVGDITDFESILDVCSAVFDTERLAWHYRSHYEQLISFSNLNFYNNNLVTFPSALKDRKGIGVDYYFVDGVFDRRSKTNRIEAEYIVNLVYRHIKEHPERSLGVVAFSASQQKLIDDLLANRRIKDPSYEWFFREDRFEPFFVKNLETVQGDERDTIIFSVAYAKDSQGRFILNFGPLNRAGGERRLNVAITRAKDNVQLVSSIHATDINLSNTNSEGVRLLRAYLDYAQNGEEALERSITVSSVDKYDSYFEQEVCEYLRDQGFTVDTQIGCSGFKIDLGLRKPDSSNYVLAIECDGATYHNSKNARDRDRLRQRVLENMGWDFYRIWSTDWYKNKQVEKDRLLQAAKKALEKSNHNDHHEQDNNLDTEEMEKRFVFESQKPKQQFSKYREVDAIIAIRVNHNNFQKAVLEILKTEAPLSEDYLLKRVVGFFGKEKVTQTVINDYHRKIYRCKEKGIIRRDGFLYLADMKKITFRVPGNKREIKYISKEELAVGFYELIKQNVTAAKEGLYSTMTNLLGFSRTGEMIKAKYDLAIKLLFDKGLIDEENGILSLRS